VASEPEVLIAWFRTLEVPLVRMKAANVMRAHPVKGSAEVVGRRLQG
jgi:hypothetical protein